MMVRREPGETPLPKIQISLAGSRVEGTHITQPILSLATYICSKRNISITSKYGAGYRYDQSDGETTYVRY